MRRRTRPAKRKRKKARNGPKIDGYVWAKKGHADRWTQDRREEDQCEPSFKPDGILVQIDRAIFLYDVKDDLIFRMKRRSYWYYKIAMATITQNKVVRNKIKEHL